MLYSVCSLQTGDFNGMDCTDIVVGMARGDLGRVVDSYTRDRYKFANCLQWREG
jgi:hypothetical protein